MKLRRLVHWVLALASSGLALAAAAQTAPSTTVAPPAAASAPASLSADSRQCLECHAKPVQGADAEGAKRDVRAHDTAAFAQGVHGSMQCADCHAGMDQKAPHQQRSDPKPECASCHTRLWDEAKAQGGAASKPGLAHVAEQIEKYKLSVHSQPNADDETQANATCAGCHDTHAFKRVPADKADPDRVALRLAMPETCGSCHDVQLEEFQESVHGEVIAKGKARAAVCSDCHNPHGVDRMSAEPAKLHTTQACMSCHASNAQSYTDTFHGRITSLGYAYAAQCFNCHDSHAIKSPEDEDSKVHEDNRLKTCQKCHKEATAGFVSYQPHATTDDFDRYPQMWLTSKFMIGLLGGTFAFFWIHLLLWLYREVQDRRQGKTRPHVNVAALGIPPGKEVRRFGAWWRLGHLLFAVSLMILTLTGMTLLYAGSDWAPVVVRMLGGPQSAAIIHRVNAVIFMGVFVVHLVYIAIQMAKNWRTFRLFGPNSLIPGPQDLKDVIAMFKWFLGLGPRPVFDRWTYWEKFDYWAPFWGVAIVGVSGLLMWFPNVTASVLPGWVFNVAALTHGEEAFLAAVFLFTVHFFNNHFRPDKFPFDPVMFTGSVPVEHFAREHTLQYRRLVQTGEIKDVLVDAPSRPFTVGSYVLGAVLIAFGLVLLVLIAVGFTQTMLR